MPRFLSAVTALAWSSRSAGATQTLSTPSSGATQLRYFPSGLIWTAVRSGLLNSSSRGIRSGAGAARANAGANRLARAAASKAVFIRGFLDGVGNGDGRVRAAARARGAVAL